MPDSSRDVSHSSSTPPKRRRWLKRLALLVVAGVVLIAVVAGWAAWKLRSVPDFYTQEVSAEQLAELRAAAERKTARFHNDLEAAFTAAGRPKSAGDAADKVNRSARVVYDANELDALFRGWIQNQGYESRFTRHMSDPRLALADGYLILAGRMKELDTVVSAYFKPSVDEDGRVTLSLDKVYGGKLPLPAGLFESYRGKLIDTLTADLPNQQRRAAISERGVANDAAVAAGMAQQLVDLLQGKQVHGTVFIELPLRPDVSGRIPASISEMTIEQGELSLSVELLTSEQRAKLLERIKAGGESASEVTEKASDEQGHW